MLLSVLTTKSKVPGHSFHPLRSRSRLERFPQGQLLCSKTFTYHSAWVLPPVPRFWLRKQISAGSSLKVRCPDSALGARHLRPNWPSSSSGGWNGGDRARRALARQTAVAIRSQGQGYRRDSPHLKADPASGLPWRGPWSLTGHSPQPVSWTAQLMRWPKARRVKRAPGESRDPLLNLTLHLRTTAPLTVGSLTVAIWQLFTVGGAQCRTDQWLNRTINRCYWTVICLGEGPTVEADQWIVRSNRKVCQELQQSRACCIAESEVQDLSNKTL